MENPYAAPRGEIIHPTSTFVPLTWKQILFSFQGRIPRRQFWGGQLVQILLFGVLCLLVGLSTDAPGLGALVLLVLLVPLYVIAIWYSLALNAKRAHDRDKSGWFILVALIPIIGSIWLLIELGFLRGTEGDNRYGGDPT